MPHSNRNLDTGPIVARGLVPRLFTPPQVTNLRYRTRGYKPAVRDLWLHTCATGYLQNPTLVYRHHARGQHVARGFIPRLFAGKPLWALALRSLSLFAFKSHRPDRKAYTTGKRHRLQTCATVAPSQRHRWVAPPAARHVPVAQVCNLRRDEEAGDKPPRYACATVLGKSRRATTMSLLSQAGDKPPRYACATVLGRSPRATPVRQNRENAPALRL